MNSVKSYISLLGVLLLMAPAGYGQSRNNRGPQLSTEGGFLNNWKQKYSPGYVPAIDMSNSGRMEQLVRAGNLYLSLNDAIALALENNLGLEIQRYQFDITEAAYRGSLAGPNGAWDPVFAVNQFNYNHQVSPVTNNIGTSGSVNTQDSYQRGFQLQQNFKTGLQGTFGFTSSKVTTNNINDNFIPRLTGNLNLNVSQPLLRGFGVGLNTINVKVAENNRRAVDYTFQTQINTTLNQVIQAYWNLVSASLNVGVARQALDVFERQLAQTKTQIEIGTVAPIEIEQTNVQVANGQSTLIQAEATVQTQENNLKNLISRNGIANPTLSTVHIIPTSRVEVPAVEPIQPIQDLLDTALRNRPELSQARINLENTDLNLKSSRNNLLPQLNLTGGLSNPATGGVVNTNPLPNGQPRSFDPIRTGGFSNTLYQLFALPTINYNLGFTFNINLRNRSAQAAYAQAELQKRTQELQLQNQMNTIRTDVANAQINIATARARAEAAQRALDAQERVVDGEQRKFQLGTSTLFVVIQQQNQLASARQNLVTAQVAYANAKLAMDVATGSLMDKYNVVFDDAKAGSISRRPDPIPDVVNQNAQNPGVQNATTAR